MTPDNLRLSCRSLLSGSGGAVDRPFGSLPSMQFAAFGALDQVLVPFARVDSPIERLRVECNSLTLAVEAFDLKFAEFHVEVVDEIFKYIARLGHKSRRLLIRQNFFDVLIRPFEIREK